MKTPNNNYYYTIEENYYALIYETIPHWIPNDLRSCTSSLGVAHLNANYWAEKLHIKIMIAKPGSIIFVAQKRNKWWNIIVEEKTGWLYMNDWFVDKVTPLKIFK